jgi:hypothetical protein
MLGSAMRRWRVKYSASPQLAAAMLAPETARSTLMVIQLMAIRISATAMETKISLKPVSRRNCSSSTAGEDRLPAMKVRRLAASFAPMAPALTAASSSLSE